MYGKHFLYFFPVCGGTFTTNNGAFTSPSYPGEYAHNRVCTWTIEVIPGRSVQLTFDDFDIEQHQQCAYDYVEVKTVNNCLPLGDELTWSESASSVSAL